MDPRRVHKGRGVLRDHTPSDSSPQGPPDDRVHLSHRRWAQPGLQQLPIEALQNNGLEPGDRLWPYHTHHLNEEWIIVLGGEPTLRNPEGEQVLKEGDVVCFPRGNDGPHQIINRTDSPIRVLMLSSMIGGEIIEYRDTGKILAKGVDDEDIMFARPGPTVEYWEGEE